MVSFRQAEPKQIKHSNNQVELSRDAKVQQECREHVADEIASVEYFVWCERQVQIDVPVKDEVQDTTCHPINTDLVNLIGIVIVIIPAKCFVIDYGKQWETNVRKEKEIGQSLSY